VALCCALVTILLAMVQTVFIKDLQLDPLWTGGLPTSDDGRTKGYRFLEGGQYGKHGLPG